MEKGICFPYYVFNSNEPGLLARASDNITRFYELIILFKFYRWKTRDLLLYVSFQILSMEDARSFALRYVSFVYRIL